MYHACWMLCLTQRELKGFVWARKLRDNFILDFVGLVNHFAGGKLLAAVDAIVDRVIFEPECTIKQFNASFCEKCLAVACRAPHFWFERHISTSFPLDSHNVIMTITFLSSAFCTVKNFFETLWPINSPHGL